MGILLIILHMAGAVALLLYSVRMVRTGVERASGPALRRAIADPTRGWIASAAVGTVIAVFLQSSTATAVLASGFAANGLVPLTSGLALLLGADVGTALVVQFLSFDLEWLAPLLLAAGGWLFLKHEARGAKQLGRIFLGIALILVSLRLIGEATVPLKESPFMPAIAAYLASDMITAFLAGAVVTFLFHSSVASVLMIAAFTAQGMLAVEASLAMIFGANAGGGILAVWLTRASSRDARLLPLGNCLFRVLGAMAALAAFAFTDPPLAEIGATPARQVVNGHLLFNMALLVLCLPLIGPMSKLVEQMIPRQPTPGAQQARLKPASALNREVIKSPELALASATRELLRMSEIVEVMIRPIMEFFETGNKEEIERIRLLDDEVDEAHNHIKLYLAEVNRGELSAEEAERGIELTSFAINLERAGDIVSKNLLELVLKMHKVQVRFSPEGWSELTNLHDRVMANMQLALNVLVSGDVESARQLIAEKDRMRKLERESHDRHLLRLRKGSEESIESSNIHLDTVRALKEINSLFATVAIPILARSGQLRDTRLVDTGKS